MVGVYLNAAKAREQGKATRGQLTNAKSALARLTEAARSLAKVSSDGRDGLRMLVEGSPLDDEKGDKELNQIAAVCWGIRIDVIRSAQTLQSAITAEEKKRTERGERRKRLRTLVDSSHLGGYPREENPLRPMSRLIDVMRAKQSFMGGLGNFESCDRLILQPGWVQKIRGRGGGDERARSATCIERRAKSRGVTRRSSIAGPKLAAKKQIGPSFLRKRTAARHTRSTNSAHDQRELRARRVRGCRSSRRHLADLPIRTMLRRLMMIAA